MANELLLKYGCNPNQKPSRIFMKDGGELPIEVLNGKPGYINFLDAFNSWQFVKDCLLYTSCAERRFGYRRLYLPASRLWRS